MKLPKIISYETPEGTHEGPITNAELKTDTKRGHAREFVRLTMAAESIKDEVYDYYAGANYWSAQGNELMTDLYSILGSDAGKLRDSNGDINPDRLSLLIGKQVRFDVVHKPMPGHNKAYRLVQNIRPINPPQEQRRAA